MIDTHTHTRFSDDSNELPERLIETAISKGITYLAITDHVDRDYLFGDIRQTSQIDMAEYFPYIKKLQDKYSKDITLGIGAEFGYTKLAIPLYQKIDDDYSLDITINSIHTIQGKDAYFPEFFKDYTKEKAYSLYLDAVLESINVPYQYDVIAHIGYITRNAPYKNKALYYNEYKDIIDTILSSIISKNKALEINTRSVTHNTEFMPCREIVERYKELGGELITFASDAHIHNQVGNKYDLVRDFLLSLGYKYICSYIKHKPKMHLL